MKKLLSIIVSCVFVLGLVVGVSMICIDIQNNTEYNLKIEVADGGTVNVYNDSINYNQINTSNIKSYKAKNKTEFQLKAIANNNYEFVGWTINGDAVANINSEITVKLTKNITYKANFEVKKLNLSVSGESVNESFEYSCNQNLLSLLNEKYTAPAGYKYIFKIDNQEIDETTEISSDSEIVIKKQLIQYTVTFKIDGNKYRTKNYTVENYTRFTAPSVPSRDGYIGSWEEYDLSTLGDKIVNAVYVEI